MRKIKSKIIYMGTPEFALPALELLNQLDYLDVVLVVSQADKPRGRGKKFLASPVKKRALELGLETAEPLDIKGNSDFINRIKDLAPDLIVVAAYGKILTKELLEIPCRGCVNIHASLLPKYRGSAPIHRAIIAGEKVSGVTLMYMSEGLDQGDMLAQAEVSLEGMNTGQAYEIFADIGAELLLDNLESILGGDARAEKQDDAEATYAPPVLKEEGHIEFDKLSAEAAANLIRGLTPKPGAYVYVSDDVKLKITEAHVDCSASLASDCPTPSGMTGSAGTVLEAGADGIIVATLEGVLVIDSLQAPGGKMMRASDYLRGHELPIGTVLR